MSSGYRRVNYYELCRLCTSSEGNKIYIFREEGRRRQLQTKIQTCLPIQVLEEDSLPKIVCHDCIRKLESFMEFRETVVSAEGMLESYFTSLRFSEDFLKEGKVYVKNTEKEKPKSPEPDPLSTEEKAQASNNNQAVGNEQPIHQQPIVVSNINASNIQIISGVQARVQQYKCAMQMQPGGVAAAVVEATAETHYSYQQQTAQQVSPQSNEAQNQITDQHQTAQIQSVQGNGQINQQVQPQRQISQQLNQQTTSQINQQQDQTQITHQMQQLQRQQRDFKPESQAQVVHQNNNIVLKSSGDTEQNQQIIQKVDSDGRKDENNQNYTTVQSAPAEVFLSLGFKENSLTAQTVQDDGKEYGKNTNEDAISRNTIGHISEFLRIRSGPETSPLITVNPQVISQNNRHAICCDCGTTFNSVNDMNDHDCKPHISSMINESESTTKEENAVQATNNSSAFNCDICSKPFKRKEHLFQHRKLHTGERPFVCTVCTKAFSRKEHLVRHSVSHTGQKVHECEMCGKSFSRKDNLHKHRKTHGVSGPYICENCGKSFVVKHYYLMHLSTHAPPDNINCPDPLPYKCDLCLKAFSVKQYLTMHKLRHRTRNNNNNSTQNTLNGQQQQQQQQQPQQTQQQNGTSTTTLNSNNGQQQSSVSSNGSPIEMQGVVERSEQTNGSFTNGQYHNNMQEFQ